MRDRHQKGRIAFFNAHNFIDAIPSLCNAVEMLAAAGYEVDVFTSCADEPELPIFSDPRVRLFADYARIPRYSLYRLFPRKMFLPLLALRRHLKNPYRYVIGVDPGGLVAADRFNRFIQAPLVYWSLEIYFSDEIKDRPLLVKEKEAEVELSRKCRHVIIQDEIRGKALAKENGLAMDRLVYVPNAPRGKARRLRSDHWVREFGLSPNTKIALFAGSLHASLAIEDIAGSVSSWPEGWVLVIHTRVDYDKNPDKAFIIQILRTLTDPKRVFVSRSPVGRKDYESLIDGADIGIVFNRAVPGQWITQRNSQLMGLSSGKLAYYLHAGLPVISNRYTTVGPFIHENGCGVDVEGSDEIANAIRLIDADFDTFSQNACVTFDTYLDFKPSFQKAMETLGL